MSTINDYMNHTIKHTRCICCVLFLYFKYVLEFKNFFTDSREYQIIWKRRLNLFNILRWSPISNSQKYDSHIEIETVTETSNRLSRQSECERERNQSPVAPYTPPYLSSNIPSCITGAERNPQQTAEAETKGAGGWHHPAVAWQEVHRFTRV